MNFDILKPEVQTFINNALKLPIDKVVLNKNPFATIAYHEITNQIVAKAKAETKLPTWFNTKNIIYPIKISIEQTSSEITAQYKATLVQGDSLIDLTGGFGVDDYYFSKQIKHITHCEIDENLHKIVKHNFETLNIKNIHCYLGDSYNILNQLQKKFHWIYIDPSRRSAHKGKVFMLKDCLPNVPLLSSFYFQFTTNILIKTAPILDLTAGINELQNVKEIHIVALNNEVKELLWILEKEHTLPPIIKAVNITKEQTELFSFQLGEQTKESTYSLPKKYLYEPNHAIMKSGAFHAISTYYKVDKLHPFSHLYTLDTLIDFPGRRFIITNVIEYNKTEMKIHLMNKKVNVTTRNFSETVENIRKKWKLSDGGNLYCFFTTNSLNKKIVLICEKI